MAETIAIIVLFVWIFIIQFKQVEIAESLNDIKKELKRKYSEVEQSVVPIPKENEISEQKDNTKELDLQNSEPLSIDDISDIEVFSKTVAPVPDLKTAHKTRETSIEQLMLGNLFNKIGALAIFVGLIAFIKFVFPNNADWVKLATGFIAGIGFIIAALKLKAKENLQNFSEVLLGTGFGALFITTYCGSTFLKILNVPSALIIATLTLLAAFYTADKMKTVSMLAITMVAGYLNPLFINPNEHNFLFGYLIFVNLLGIIYTYRNKNRSTVNIINLLLTFLYTSFWADNLLYPAILWVMYFVYDIVENLKTENLANKLLNYANFAIFAFFAMIILDDKIQLGSALLIIAFMYVITAVIKYKNEETFKHYIHLFLSATAVSVYFFTVNNFLWRVYIWSIETVVLAFFAEKYEQKEFANWAVGTSVVAAVAALCTDEVIATSIIKDFNPIWNIRLWTIAPVVISGVLSSKISANTNTAEFKKFVNIFKMEYLSMLYVYVGFEANDIINKMYIGHVQSANFIAHMKNVILGFVYTIQLKNLYNVTKFRAFAHVSLYIGIISLVYLLAFGCTYKPVTSFLPVINVRFLAFLIAITAAIMNARWTGKEIFKYIAILLGFVLLHIEINDSIERFRMDNAEYLLSIGWILYAGIVTIIGIFRDKPYLKMCGIILCGFAITRIFIYDLAHVNIIYKFLAFLTLGTILLILSYFYNKKQK